MSLSSSRVQCRARSLKSRVLHATTGGRIGPSSAGVSEIVALDGVSLRLEHGDHVGLIGHNGAGKTTPRIMAGIYEPCVGRVSVEGRWPGVRYRSWHRPEHRP
jgi:ABC-2 type transport system ATP-binding protein/lipopolysaccharide transport system ATP-binding protein